MIFYLLCTKIHAARNIHIRNNVECIDLALDDSYIKKLCTNLEELSKEIAAINPKITKEYAIFKIFVYDYNLTYAFTELFSCPKVNGRLYLAEIQEKIDIEKILLLI